MGKPKYIVLGLEITYTTMKTFSSMATNRTGNNGHSDKCMNLYVLIRTNKNPSYKCKKP